MASGRAATIRPIPSSPSASIRPLNHRSAIVEAVDVDGGEHVGEDRLAFLQVELDAAALLAQLRQQVIELEPLLVA